MTKQNGFLRAGLAILLVAGVFGIIGALFVVPIPDENRDLISYLINTVVAAGAMLVINYVFGSSSGSAAKSKTIEEFVADKPKPAVPVFKP